MPDHEDYRRNPRNVFGRIEGVLHRGGLRKGPQQEAAKKEGKGLVAPDKKRKGVDASDQVVDDDKGEEQKSKKEKPPKNPFKIAPHAYTEDIFRICQPFVRVCFSDVVSLTDEDKVLDGKRMDKEALKTAIIRLCEGFIHSSMLLKSRSHELGLRDLHTSLAKSFWLLSQRRTQPEVSRRRLSRHTQDKGRGQGLKGVEGVQQGMLIKEPTQDHEENEGLEVILGEEATLGDIGKESNESSDCLFDGDEEESKNKTSSHFDISFRVVDKRIQGMDNDVIVLVVECKHGSLSLNDLFQVAAYACTLIKGNMRKGRYEPLYMEVWNEGLWRYAIFYPEGLVKIEDSEISNVERASTPNEELQESLNACKDCLSKEYARSDIPDDIYVHGLLYISMRKFVLPHTNDGGMMSKDAKLFFQSKLRIIVGDEVLGWSVDDVEAAVRARRKQLEENIMSSCLDD